MDLPLLGGPSGGRLAGGDGESRRRRAPRRREFQAGLGIWVMVGFDRVRGVGQLRKVEGKATVVLDGRGRS